jgi:hypothetical protein
MGFKIPTIQWRVEGAEGREKHLENDDLLPVPLEQRLAHVAPVVRNSKNTNSIIIQNLELLDIQYFLVQRRRHCRQLAWWRNLLDRTFRKAFQSARSDYNLTAYIHMQWYFQYGLSKSN